MSQNIAILRTQAIKKMKMKRFLCLLAMLAPLFANAQKVEIPKAEIVYGPWIQNVTEDSFTVLFTTSTKCLCEVELAPDNGKQWYQEAYPKFYETSSGRRLYSTFHAIKVTGLQKATSYRYRIVGKPVFDDSSAYALVYGAERAIGGRHTVKTLDYSAPTCRFSMVNDMHFDTEKYSKLIGGMDKKKTDFIVLNGDIISFSNALDTLLKYTFDPIKEYCGDFPVIFARGNHEGRGAEWYKTNAAFPTSSGEFYYTFRQGPVGFIVLDAGEDKPDSDPEYSGQGAYDQYRAEELEWMKKAIKEPAFADAPVKVCLMHIPTFDDDDAWYSQHWIAQHFTPVLNEAGVKLMLSGHHHRYILAKPGEYGNAYTIVANNNNERIDFEAGLDGKITLKFYDKSGALVRTLNID